jgi:hypothetical protein
MLTQERLKELLDYDEKTGVFTWKADGRRHVAGSIAGHEKPNGYLHLWIESKKYHAHRLAWLYVHGNMPKHQIDHINHNRADNRIVNLRDVSPLENQRNASLRNDNSSGVCGVCFDKTRNKWISRIKLEGKRKNLGRFHDFFAAVCARKSAEVKYGFHENHGAMR